MAQDRNYAQFFVLLKHMKGASKEMLVCQYTSGRTESLREMTDAEYRTMLRGLSCMVNNADKLRQARSKALYQLMIYGVDTSNWDEINRFVKQPRIAGKVFYNLTIPELEALTKKMRGIIGKGQRKAAQEAIDKINAIAIYSSTKQQPS